MATGNADGFCLTDIISLACWMLPTSCCQLTSFLQLCIRPLAAV